VGQKLPLKKYIYICPPLILPCFLTPLSQRVLLLLLLFAAGGRGPFQVRHGAGRPPQGEAEGAHL